MTDKNTCARCGHKIEPSHNGIALYQDGSRTHGIYDCFAYVKAELDKLKGKKNDKSNTS